MQNNLLKSFLALTLFALAFSSCTTEQIRSNNEEAALQAQLRSMNERVVVADRVSGTVTVIDAAADTVLATIPMPDGGEPMYVVHIDETGKFYVGDRANERVVIFDQATYAVDGFIPAGDGVFHMWATDNGRLLFVNNDVDNTTSVIKPSTQKLFDVADTPADLVALGGKPHDVIPDRTEKSLYVSVLGVSGANDYIVKYDGLTMTEVARAAVGKDPHLSLTNINGYLYAPCQNGNAIYVLNRSDLSLVTTIPFNGAHGAGMSNSGQYFYSADIGGSRLVGINTSTNAMIAPPITAPYPTAHNLAISYDDSKMYVTHSGPTSDKVSVYTLSPAPTYLTGITVGLNPFGLAYYAY